jgi:prepilin-type N-terminal cleavage/methylation domain-containing protein
MTLVGRAPPVRARRGFTLIELVMVLMLVALLMTGGYYSLRTATAREEVDGWARSIAYDLQSAQQAAITQRTTVTASFQNQTYSIVAGGTTLRQQTLPSHISLGGTLQTISFDRRGTPSNTFTLTITSSSGRTYTVAVESGTGRVTFSGP